MRILTVIPAATQAYCDEYAQLLKPYLAPSTELKVTFVDDKLPDLEYYYYGALTTPRMLSIMKNAEDEGYDATIIGCFYDTGLREAREVLTLPVIGPGEACFHHAAMLAEAIGVVAGRRKTLPKYWENARTYGVWDKIVAWEVSEASVQELRYRNEAIYQQLRSACERAMHRGAEAIVLACGSMSFYAARLAADLRCAVLDPRIIAVKYAEMAAQLYRSVGLSHAKRWGYETPPILPGDVPVAVGSGG